MNHYTIRTFYSPDDEGFISTFAEIPSLSAFGETASESLQELEQVYSSLQELEKLGKVELPTPYSTESLAQTAKLLNISELARQSNLPVQTLASKIKRGTALAKEEMQAISHTLQSAGIHLS